MDDTDPLAANESLVFTIRCFICKPCSLNLSVISSFSSCCLNVRLHSNPYLSNPSRPIDIHIVPTVFFTSIDLLKLGRELSSILGWLK